MSRDRRVRLRAGDLEAAFVPTVGMVGVELSHRGAAVLSLPGGLAAYRAGHTTGLPLLYPWANRLSDRSYRAGGVPVDLAGLDLHTDANGLPIHGTMTAQTGWEVIEVGPTRLVAAFDFAARPDLLASFPFPHRLELNVTLDPDALRITTVVEPTARRPVPIAFGFHPYLRLPDAPRRDWMLSRPAARHLTLDERGIPTGAATAEAAEDAPIGDRCFDDGYELDGQRQFVLTGGSRRLEVSFDEGYPNAQIFVPAGKRFVAIEPMTAPTNALVAGTAATVAPGERFTATFRLIVTDD